MSQQYFAAGSPAKGILLSLCTFGFPENIVQASQDGLPFFTQLAEKRDF